MIKKICIAALFVCCAVSQQLYAAQVAAGGIVSSGCNTNDRMADAAVGGNHDLYRSAGGMIYIHELGWLDSSAGTQNAIKGHWPSRSSVMFETSYPQAAGSTQARYNEWGGSGKFKVVCANFLTHNISQTDAVNAVNSIKQYADYVAPIESPNGAGANLDFNHPDYDVYKKACEAGGALATDAPPSFFLANSQAYKSFLYQQVAWAKSKGLKVVCLVSPHVDDNYIGNAEHFRNTLAANSATPDFWGVLNYGVCQHGNWIGNEDDFATQFGVARHIFLLPGPTVSLRKKNYLSYALDGGVGAGNGHNVKLYSYSPSNINQQFQQISIGGGYYMFRKKYTEHAIDGGGGGSERQNVKLWEIGYTNVNQHWKKVNLGGGYYRLEKKGNGFSIDGDNGAGDNQNVYLWYSNNGNNNQQWKIE